MWYRIDCDDCISAIIASAREAGEAKGRAEEREACVKIAVYYKTFKVNEPALSIEQAIRARGEAAK